MGAPRTYDKLYDFLLKHKDLEISLNLISTETGLKRDQIINAMRTLRLRGNNIGWVVMGSTIKLSSAALPTAKTDEKRMFEEIGVTKSGAIVIQDEDGNLYKAEEI